MKRYLTTAVLALLAVQPVSAVVVANSLNDAERIAAAAQFDGKVVAVIADYPAGDTYPAGSVAASGTVVNRNWVLTSKHYIDLMLPYGAIFSVSTGRNFKTAPGTILGVERMVLSGNSEVDLVLLKISGSLPGAIEAVFARPVVGELNYYVGYGVKADLSNGSKVYSGDRRLFTEPTVDVNSLDFIGSFLSVADRLSGKGYNYDSGGGVFNQYGQQTGIMLIQSGDFNYGFTGSQNLGNLDIQNWIFSTVTDPTGVTDPPKLTTTVTLTSAQLTLSNLIIGREYRVMRSSSLGAWEEANRFTATSATGSWSEALAPEGRRFYRLEWNE